MIKIDSRSRLGALAPLILAAGLAGCGGPEFAPELEGYVEQVMERFEIPGIAVAIVQDGETLYTSAFGVASLESGKPLAAESLFHMASVSKPFVATAILQLVERGQIDLDAPVTMYLPYFELGDVRYRGITIRQMLNHTSGMPDVEDYEWHDPQYDDGAAERYVRSLRSERLISDPGDHYHYSNMAFDVLGDLIGKVSGLPFETYVEQNILDPLGMSESSFLFPATSETLRTTPHVWNMKPVVGKHYPYNRRHAPSSTLNSSVVEMANWARVNLNRGELEGVRILESESFDRLWADPIEVSDKMSVGLSWFLATYEDTPIVFHGGHDKGYRSHIALLPEKKIAVILASNYDETPMYGLRDGVLDIVLGIEPRMPKLSIAQAFVKVYVAEGLEAAKAHYRELESEEQDQYAFGDRELNLLGYRFLWNDEPRRAIEIFLFNVELFPEVANTYDSLAEGYMVYGQDELAIRNYRKSLELDPGNKNAEKMLARLGAQVW